MNASSSSLCLIGERQLPSIISKLETLVIQFVATLSLTDFVPLIVNGRETALYIKNKIPLHKASIIQPFEAVHSRFVVPLEKDNTFHCLHLVDYLV